MAPLTAPAEPGIPAYFVTSPVLRSMVRMALFSKSETYMVALPTITMKAGLFSMAAAPIPSTAPAVPATPASVSTVHAMVSIFRMTWLDMSATNKCLSNGARPAGVLNRAELAGPSAWPGTETAPAAVVTAHEPLSMARMTWASESETYSVLPATTTSAGKENLAAVPVASTLPYTPASPATVKTAPVVTFTERMTPFP